MELVGEEIGEDFCLPLAETAGTCSAHSGTAKKTGGRKNFFRAAGKKLRAAENFFRAAEFGF